MPAKQEIQNILRIIVFAVIVGFFGALIDKEYIQDQDEKKSE